MRTGSKLHLTIAIVISVLGISLFSCTYTPDKETAKRSSEIESVKNAIHGAIGWAKNKDFKLLYGIIANDSGYLEVDPGPGLIRGFDEFRKNESFRGSKNGLWFRCTFLSRKSNKRYHEKYYTLSVTKSISKSISKSWKIEFAKKGN